MSMKILKQITTELMVDDVDESINFYREILGFSVIVSEPKEKPFFVILQNGDVELMLYHKKQFSEEIPQFKHKLVGGSIALYIGVEGIHELYKSMKDSVTIIQKIHTTDYGSIEFSCEDNSGYVLMFNERKVNEENKVYRSVLMGAPKTTDAEFKDLDIEITHKADSGTRKILIPVKSLEKYKMLVRNKLDNGFWNDFVGDDLIYFIFKMPDGEIKEFVYNEKDRLKIAGFCSKLNHDPIEKTSDLLNYLANNEFYTEAVEAYKIKQQ